MPNDESNQASAVMCWFVDSSGGIRIFPSPPDAFAESCDAVADGFREPAAFLDEFGKAGFAGPLVKLLQHFAAEFAIRERPAAFDDVAADGVFVVTEAMA